MDLIIFSRTKSHVSLCLHICLTSNEITAHVTEQEQDLSKGSGPDQDAGGHVHPVHRVPGAHPHGADRHLPRQGPQLRRPLPQPHLRPLAVHQHLPLPQLLPQLLHLFPYGVKVQGDAEGAGVAAMLLRQEMTRTRLMPRT